MSEKKGRSFAVILLLAAGCTGLLIAAAGGGLAGIGQFLIHADDLQRAGAVVLLSGGGDERLDEAAALMRDRYAELLILTDTDKRITSGALEWQYFRLEMIERGVSPAQIEVTYHAVSSTADEAAAVREFMQRHKVSSCIIVTDPYHTLRTRLIFAREMEPAGIEVRVVPARDHWFRAGSWFLSLRGWQATLGELVKLAVFTLGG